MYRRVVIKSGAMLFRPVAVLVMVALGLASGAMAASPDQDRVLAKQHFESGARRFDLAEWEQALIEFKEAYRITPDPALLYNIAQCHRKLGHIEDALTFYKTYRRRAPDAPNRAEIDRRISELEAEQQAKQSRKASEEQQTKTAPPVPAPLPSAGAATQGNPMPENRTDLVQSADRTQPAARAETSIWRRWWLWTAIGVVVAAGGVTAVLLASRHSGGAFCSDCANTAGVNLP
jgi:tetratricopeptide (TPR) repeat protein